MMMGGKVSISSPYPPVTVVAGARDGEGPAPRRGVGYGGYERRGQGRGEGGRGRRLLGVILPLSL